MGRPLIATVRPQCPKHRTSRVWMDGSLRSWSPEQRKTLWRCVPADGTKWHRFMPPEPNRHPVGHGDACPDCDHVYMPAEGPRTGRWATFTFREVADALVDVGRGSTYRDAAARARRAARRPDTREGNLILGWLDVFGSIIVETLEAKDRDWPEAIAIDSQPFNRPSLDDEGKPKAVRNGEVLAVVNLSAKRRDPPPLRMRIAGSRDHQAWLAFFEDAGLSGAPAWIVADLDPAIEKAVALAFPQAILYNCEGHLLNNAKDAHKADGMPEWELIPPEERPGSAALGAPRGPRRNYRRTALWTALEECLWDAQRWVTFVALVEATVPANRWSLRSWIEERGDLIADQMVLRREHPGMPRSIGPIESRVFNKVRDWTKSRAGTFRNRRRLDITLGLMRAEIAGLASPVAYGAILREHYRSHGHHSGGGWRDGRDPAFTSSLADLILRSNTRGAVVRESEQIAGRVTRETKRREAAKVERAAAGLEPHTGRARRPTGSRTAVYRSVKGMRVADLSDLMAMWDFPANEAAGLDPAAIPASRPTRAFWACPVHPSHRWDASIKERATYLTGCPFCMGRRVSPTNSLAAQYPAVAAEWHPTRNGILTPHDYVRGADRKVWWQCAQGHEWEALIHSRTTYGHGCPVCAHEAHKERERGTTAKRARRSRELARTEPRPKATKTVVPKVVEPKAVIPPPGVIVPDDENF